MTDLSLIKQEYMLLSGEDEETAGEKEALFEAQAQYVSSVLKSSDNENDASVVFLCAARAFYLSLLANQSETVSSFKAGDISYTTDSSAALENAGAIYNLALAECSGLIDSASFAFKAV